MKTRKLIDASVKGICVAACLAAVSGKATAAALNLAVILSFQQSIANRIAQEAVSGFLGEGITDRYAEAVKSLSVTEHPITAPAYAGAACPGRIFLVRKDGHITHFVERTEKTGQVSSRAFRFHFSRNAEFFTGCTGAKPGTP